MLAGDLSFGAVSKNKWLTLFVGYLDQSSQGRDFQIVQFSSPESGVKAQNSNKEWQLPYFAVSSYILRKFHIVHNWSRMSITMS